MKTTTNIMLCIFIYLLLLCTLTFAQTTTIADNGCFNEAIQQTGGNQIAYFDGKTHVVYLSRLDTDGLLGIYIQSYDHATKQWGTPRKLDNAGTSFDTHNAPSIFIDHEGYINIFYGCHYSPIKYVRSLKPNESGCFEGETGGFTEPKTIGAHFNSYPVGWEVSSTGRIYVACRTAAKVRDELRYSYYYSDDRGATWQGPFHFIYYGNDYGLRVYAYGIYYDDSTQRLHIAFTFVDKDLTSRGVWYAYSDYDSNSEMGFLDWYQADGKACGTTSADYESTSPIDIEKLDPVITADDWSVNFVTTMTIDKENKPVIFFTREPKILLGTEEVSLMCARYDNGWTITDISQKIGHKLRVRRSGSPAVVTGDSTIHCFIPVRTTQSVDYPPAEDLAVEGNTTYSAGKKAYDLLDEGIDYCDLDGSFVSGVNQYSMEFKSDPIDDTNITITGVTVEAVLKKDKRITGRGDIYLKQGNNQIKSEAFKIKDSVYQRYRYTWNLNPFDSTAWTIDAVNKTSFGFEQIKENASISVSSIVKRIHYLPSTITPPVSCDMLHLKSTDNGRAWTSKPIWQNDPIGIPIVSAGYNRDSDKPEVVWTAGYDLLYWSGGEDTIVRKSDSSKEIIFSEDFESFVNGDDINGRNGWVVTDGTATIWQSPPKHANKVFSGEKSIETTASWRTWSFKAERKLDSSVTNITINAAFVLGAKDGKIYIEAIDSSGQSFAVGIDYDSVCAVYENPEGWYYDSEIRMTDGNMIEVTINITPEGCSGYLWDYPIVLNDPAIRSCAKVRLGTGNTLGYFDHILITKD